MWEQMLDGLPAPMSNADLNHRRNVESYVRCANRDCPCGREKAMKNRLWCAYCFQNLGKTAERRAA